MKSGYKTTEFYVTLAAGIGAAAAALSGAVPPSVGAILVSVSGGAYAISRGLAKLNAAGVTNFDPNALLADIEKIVSANAPAPAPPAPPAA